MSLAAGTKLGSYEVLAQIGGWPTLSRLLVHGHARLDDTTRIRQP
jgi:hypothetical protein